jgi:hypothetical protein
MQIAHGHFPFMQIATEAVSLKPDEEFRREEETAAESENTQDSSAQLAEPRPLPANLNNTSSPARARHWPRNAYGKAVGLRAGRSASEDGNCRPLDRRGNPAATLLDLARIKLEAEDLTGIPFDVRTPRSLSKRFRDAVLREAKSL